MLRFLSIVSLVSAPLIKILSSPYDIYAVILNILAGLSSGILEDRNKKKLAKELIEKDRIIQETMLDDLMKLTSVTILSFRQPNGQQGVITPNTPNNLRINIMKIDKERLEIVRHIGMTRHDDRTLTWALGQGCCGESAKENQIRVIDLTEAYGFTWEETLEKNDNKRPFDINRQQFEKTKDLKSVMCVPICDPVIEDKVIGVINLDDKVLLGDSLFQEACVVNYVNFVAGRCGIILDKLGKLEQ